MLCRSVIHSVLSLAFIVLMGCSKQEHGNDDSLPMSPVISYPENGASIGMLTIEFAGSGKAGNTINLYTSQDPYTTIATAVVQNNGTWRLPSITFAEGAYKAFARANNNAGVFSGYSPAVEFAIDVTIPAQPVVDTAITSVPLSDATPLLTGIGEVGATLVVSIDGVSAGSVTIDSDGIWAYEHTSVLTEGGHTGSIVITDQAGNTNDAPVTFNFSIDTELPTIVAPAGLVTNIPLLVDTTVTDASAVSYSWEQVSGPGTAIFSDATGEDTTVSADMDGIYIVRFNATDAAGNIRSTDITVTWDTSAPVIDSGGDILTQSALTLAGTVSDLSSITSAVWSVQSGPAAGSITGNSSFTGSSNGTYVLRLTATDQFGYTAYDERLVEWAPLPVTAPLYAANGANWNDYVINNGADAMRASGAACTGSENGNYFACIHGGEKVSVPVTGKSTCVGLTAADALGVFAWTCSDASNPVRMVSAGLKEDKQLTDLLDFSAP
ncbi:MAG: Ig-like domain-containing protein, partial [Gammaproteobacteria bacterium]|nr:Ig-like domain-containing protein [Gammaproteobacteria bacterium]